MRFAMLPAIWICMLSFILPTSVPAQLAAKGPIALFVLSECPYKTLKEFVDWGRKKDVISALSPAKIQSHDILLQTFGTGSGLKIRITHLSGMHEVIFSMQQGLGQCGVAYLGALSSGIKEGRIIPLSIASDQRDALFPDVPTFKELGYDVVAP